MFILRAFVLYLLSVEASTLLYFLVEGMNKMDFIYAPEIFEFPLRIVTINSFAAALWERIQTFLKHCESNLNHHSVRLACCQKCRKTFYVHLQIRYTTLQTPDEHIMTVGCLSML